MNILKGFHSCMAPLEAKIMEIYTFRFCFSLKTSNDIVTSLQILHPPLKVYRLDGILIS